MKFYRCSKCQQVYIGILDNNNKNKMLCCGETVEELKVNQYNDDDLIHLPKISKIGNFVTISIGKETHPMLDIHYISLVVLKTNKGVQYKHLDIKDKPLVDFLIEDDEKIDDVFIYCTTHLLWSYKAYNKSLN